MGNRKNPNGIDWKAIGVSFISSVLSGILVTYLCKLLGL